MSKQFVVIGLGKTGIILTKQLSELGHSVLAIDKDPAVIQDITPFTAQAAVADATRLAMLQSFPLAKANYVILCIDSLETSLLTVLNLKEIIGLTNVIANASSFSHYTILLNMGLTSEQIFRPEHDMAINLADKLDKIGHKNILDFMPLMDGYYVMECKCPKNLIGKTIMDANLTNKLGVQIIAIRSFETNKLNAVPKASYEFKEGDILFLFGPNEALEKIN